MPTVHTLAAISIAVPLALALAVLVRPAHPGPWRSRLALLGPAAVLTSGVLLWPRTRGEEAALHSIPWLPAQGVDLDLRVDRLGAFFILLIGGIGLGVYQYARKYLGTRATAGFWSLLLGFTGAMLGIVLCDNLVALYVFWELTTVSSALLVARSSDESQARQGAVQAFVVTAGGGLALLAGIVLLGDIAGTYRLSELAAARARILADDRHLVALGLLLVGAFSKSAQVPFHFWLPAAMAAPAPVSAYLHSATMVKAGVFLLARLFPIFSASPLWLPALAVVGLLSFMVAGWNALWSDDVKRLLAYSTIAYLGLLVAHYGFSARTGLRGETVVIANHALYKSALFLLVGWVEKATGTRDLRTLARERWPPHEPVGTALFGLGALAMAGSPLLLGFLGKELFLHAVTAGEVTRLTPEIAVVVMAAALSVAYALKIFTAMLFGSEPPGARAGVQRPSPWLLVIPALLLLPQVLGGAMPGVFIQPFMTGDATLPRGPAVWHGADAMLVIGVASFALGAILFAWWRRFLRVRHVPVADVLARGLARGTLAFAAWVGAALQAGGHPRYLAWTLGAGAAAALALLAASADPVALPWGPTAALAWVPGLLVAVAAVLVAGVRDRVTAAVMLGVVGYGVAFYYILFRAPDLALTQLLAESVSLVLLLLAFRQMPPLQRDRRRWWTVAAHATVALAVGAAGTAVTWLAAAAPAAARAGEQHLALAAPLAHGRNVVNVILVDFRGADTLGEVIVLGASALGVLALARRRRRRRREAAGGRP